MSLTDAPAPLIGPARIALKSGAALLFFASNASSFVTGQTYDASGGRCTY